MDANDRNKRDRDYYKRNKIKFEKLISGLSVKFINLSSDEVDGVINLTLKELISFFNVDRCMLLRESPDKTFYQISHFETVQNILPADRIFHRINLNQSFPWMMEKLVKNEVVAIESMDQLPMEAAVDRETHLFFYNKAALCVPVTVSGNVNSIIVLNSIKEGRSWPTEYFPRLRLIGEIFVNALLHKDAQEKIQKSFEEIKRLKDLLQAESEYLNVELKQAHRYGEVIGQSEAMKKLLRRMEQVAASDVTVLIMGETGTGKEMIARAIHNISNRRDRRMVKIDGASLPPSLIEGELFGREKGAYTGAESRQLGRFEIADGSTLFFDEIGELPLELQGKLLRVLQDREFERLGSTKTIKINIRLIAATNRNLAEEVQKGRFREDLYYRLNVFPLTVPPLNERIEDIPLLVNAFVDELSKKMGKDIERIPFKTMDALKRYNWPGNIRELRNVIENAVVISNGKYLNVNLPSEQGHAVTEIITLKDMEYQHIVQMLKTTDWCIKGPNGAAKLLGLQPSTLYNVMSRLGIPTRRQKGPYKD
jgi:transcriptional regulator with GAF, ATPase, and Fis domain